MNAIKTVEAVNRVYNRVLGYFAMLASWCLITCSLVGAWTIYREGRSWIGPKVERIEVPVIIQRGWNDQPAPAAMPKKHR